MADRIRSVILQDQRQHQTVDVQEEPEDRSVVQQVRGRKCLAFVSIEKENLQSESLILAHPIPSNVFCGENETTIKCVHTVI